MMYATEAALVTLTGIGQSDMKLWGQDGGLINNTL